MKIAEVQGLFIATYIAQVVIQIILLVRFKKRNNHKNWCEFLGITLVTFIYNFIALYNFAAKESLDLGTAMITMFMGGFIFIFNLVLLIIGLIIKKKNKRKTEQTIDENEIKANKVSGMKSGIIVLVCNISILFILPMIISGITNYRGGLHVKEYLEKKYGDGNYQVINIHNEYSYNGFNKYLSGYFYEIKSDYMQNTFFVRTDDDFSYVDDDYLLPVYYSEQNNLDYRLYYNDFDTSIRYNFDEFDEYIMKIIEEEYVIEEEKFEMRDVYSKYVKSYENKGFKSSYSDYLIVYDEYGRIPFMDELVDVLMQGYNKK